MLGTKISPSFVGRREKEISIGDTEVRHWCKSERLSASVGKAMEVGEFKKEILGVFFKD